MTLTIAHLLLGNLLGISKEKAPRNILKLFKLLPWLLVNLRKFTNTVDVNWVMQGNANGRLTKWY